MSKLKDKFTFLAKSKVPASEGKENGFFPFYTSSTNQNKFIDEFLYEGDSIILGTGGSPNIHFQHEKFSISTDCIVIQSKTKEYSTKLLYFYLYGNIHILKKGFQGAGLQHITKHYIENIEIPKIDIETQYRLVSQLELIQSIIDNRLKSIDLIDKLLRSIFLDMFYINNNDFKNWQEFEIKDVLIKEKGSRTGPFGSNLKHSEFQEIGDVAVLGIDNAVNNVFQWSEKRFITLKKYEELKNYTINSRDIIITIMGTIGRSAVIPENIPLAINTKHLAALTLDESKCNPYYLAQAIHTDPFISFQLKTKSRGAIMNGLNLSIIRKIKFRNPPIELQNKFETLYKDMLYKINILKGSFNSLETLFKSFIHLVFSSNGIERKNEITKYINDIFLQQELFGKINTQDFQTFEEYHKAKKLLFELLESKESRISQIYDSKNAKIKLHIL